MSKHLKTYLKKTIPTSFIIIADILLTLLLLSFYFNESQSKEVTPQASAEEVRLAGQKIVQTCQSQSGWDCYKKGFYNLTLEKGIEYAEQALYAVQDNNINLKNCHIVAHEISRAATRREPENWKQLLSKMNVNACGGGFLHGVLEAHLADNPDFKITPQFITQTCAPLAGMGEKMMCSHGLGHLVLVEKQADLEASLKICDQVPIDQTGMALECYIGMFMEDHQKLALAEHEIAPLPEYTPAYLQSVIDQCLRYQGLPGNACWNEVAEIVAKTKAYDPQPIYRDCYSAPTKEEGDHCYLKGTALLAVYYNYDTPPQLLSICDPFKENDQAMYGKCINYAISSLMGYSGKFADRGIMLCSNVSDSYQKGCFQTMGGLLKNNVKLLSERQTLCQSAPDQYKADCVGI